MEVYTISQQRSLETPDEKMKKVISLQAQWAGKQGIGQSKLEEA